MGAMRGYWMSWSPSSPSQLLWISLAVTLKCVLYIICNEWQAFVCLHSSWPIAHFLFTRLTNVGVFVELVASAIDTTLGGCGDADDDRIYNRAKKQNKTKNIMKKIRRKNNTIEQHMKQSNKEKITRSSK